MMLIVDGFLQFCFSSLNFAAISSGSSGVRYEEPVLYSHFPASCSKNSWDITITKPAVYFESL